MPASSSLSRKPTVSNMSAPIPPQPLSRDSIAHSYERQMLLQDISDLCASLADAHLVVRERDARIAELETQIRKMTTPDPIPPDAT